MHSPIMRSVLALVSVLVCFLPARASLPSPSNSAVDPCIVACPAGDSVFAVIARDANNAPTPGRDTAVDLCNCPGVSLAPVPDGGPYRISGCIVWTLTDLDGIARFPLEAGGACSGAAIRIYCMGMLMATRTSVASFDQDGDLVVDGADLALVDGKRGTSDPTADFDCDGMVTTADYDIAVMHLGHFHSSIVGVGGGAEVEFGIRPAPNPSRGSADFVLRSPVRGRALLAVYDLVGRRLATLLDREIEPGVHHIPWMGRDGAGRAVPTGVYVYRLTVGALRTHGSLVVAR